MRLLKEGDDHFVQAGIIRTSLYGTRLQQITQNRYTGFQLAFQPQQRTGDLARVGTRDPNYSNAAASWRSGDSDDGVIKVHGAACNRLIVAAGENWMALALLPGLKPG